MYASIAVAIFLYSDALLVYLLTKLYSKKIIEVSDREADMVPDSKLPIVTVLLPVYREEITLPYLVKSVMQQRYPKNKLDVRILVEPDDHHTLKAIIALPDQAGQTNAIKYNRYGFPKTVRVWEDAEISIDYVYLHPKGARTKPNALNKGLTNAKGSIVTIFDAEDRPDPRQIRKAVTYMLKHSEVSCVQARLAYYNPDQSIITKMFSIEYVQQFMVYLPLYHSLKKVVLLGGTSNYIRTDVLRNLEGWDYANVTEDADLGIRLTRLGYQTVPINTITWEEAPPKIYPWLKQRTRWNKGFIYTCLLHFKKPRALVRDLGWTPVLFLLYILASPVIFCASLPGWILFSLWWLNWFGVPLHPIADWIQEAFRNNSMIFYLSIFTFLFGIFYSPIIALEALFRQGDEYSLKKIKYSFFTSLYMDLQSIPSTIAIFELLFKPKHWHKTPHGFYVQSQKIKPHQ